MKYKHYKKCPKCEHVTYSPTIVFCRECQEAYGKEVVMEDVEIESDKK